MQVFFLKSISRNCKKLDTNFLFRTPRKYSLEKTGSFFWSRFFRIEDNTDFSRVLKNKKTLWKNCRQNRFSLYTKVKPESNIFFGAKKVFSNPRAISSSKWGRSFFEINFLGSGKKKFLHKFCEMRIIRHK